MIPEGKYFRLRILRLLEDGNERRRKEIMEKLAEYFKAHPDFKMSDEERDKCYEKSGRNIFNFKVNWEIWHLKISKLLEPVNKGTIKITEKGKKLLSSIPSNISDVDFSELIDKDPDHQEFIINMNQKYK